jgi:pimeloyl-ACP methyl ester carboxylesterase
VRRSFVEARGVRFHVTEAGEGTAVLALHGWPEHHLCYRDLLAAPPAGLRIIAPDLPGYGWSGPPPHRWAKEDVASDVLALLDTLGLERVVLVGHDWGGWISYLIALRAPERVAGVLALSIPHPWNGPRSLLPHLWRLGHMPLMAGVGRPLVAHTPFLERVLFRLGTGPGGLDRDAIRSYAERFATPVGSRITRDTYRTFLLREIPQAARRPEQRIAPMPIRAMLGSADFAVHPSLLSPRSARADDMSLEMVPGAGHFLPEEAPDRVRAALLDLVAVSPGR